MLILAKVFAGSLRKARAAWAPRLARSLPRIRAGKERSARQRYEAEVYCGTPAVLTLVGLRWHALRGARSQIPSTLCLEASPTGGAQRVALGKIRRIRPSQQDGANMTMPG